MSDYSGFSMDKLELMYKYADTAYRFLDCPPGATCKECGISKDCKALCRVKTNIYLEIFERKFGGVVFDERL